MSFTPTFFLLFFYFFLFHFLSCDGRNDDVYDMMLTIGDYGYVNSAWDTLEHFQKGIRDIGRVISELKRRDLETCIGLSFFFSLHF